jgi:hypothetical protein
LLDLLVTARSAASMTRAIAAGFISAACQHTSANVRIRFNVKHTPAHVSIRQHTPRSIAAGLISMYVAYVSIRIRQHTHTSAYVSIRQHTPRAIAAGLIRAAWHAPPQESAFVLLYD